MKERRSWVRSGLALAGLLGLASAVQAASAASAAPAADNPEDPIFARSTEKNLAAVFVLSKDLAIDPELRSAADKISAAHLARVREQLPSWIREERAIQGAGSNTNRVYYAVVARLFNELALWQVEPGDAAYEQATLAAIRSSPAVCRSGSTRPNQDFARKVLRIQAMPPAGRQAALATEAALLARWGTPRTALPAWPALHPHDVAKAALAGKTATSDGQESARTPALPPLLASLLLSDGAPYEKLARDERCLLQQWWLRASLAQGKSQEAVLNAFRYGTLVMASDRFYQESDEEADAAAANPSGRPPYPKFAARFDVTGKTTVSRRFDAQGKAIEASIVKREIAVGGIRGVRPVAFEDALDAVTLRYALHPDTAPQASGAGSPLFTMVWTLDPADGETPAAGAEAVKSGQAPGGKQ